MKIKLKSKTMPEEFEKNIEQKMQDFNLEPSPQVWNEIDAALGEKKRRRFAIWWWILPVMLGVGGVWWSGGRQSDISSQKEKIEDRSEKIEGGKQSVISDQQSAIGSQQSEEKIEDRSKKLEGRKPLAVSGQQSEEVKTVAEIGKKEKRHEEKQSLITVKKEKSSVEGNKTKVSNNVIDGIKEERSPVVAKSKKYNAEKQAREKQEAFIEKDLLSAKAKGEVTKIEKLNDNQSKIEIPAGEIATEGPSTKATNSVVPIVKEKDIAVNSLLIDNKKSQVDIVENDSAIKQQPFVAKDSSSTVAEKATQKKQYIKRGNWLINIGGGITSNKETGSKKLLSYAPASEYLSGVNTPGNSNGNGNNNSQSADSTAKIFNPGEGYHFFAGISYDYTLSKRWKISTGLQYRFLSNTQKAGKNIISTLYLGQYSNSMAFSSVPSYYNAGYASTITNKAHWLEVPVNIEYTVNPSGKTKIFLSAGASYAWMFSSKWIIPDSRSNRLYYHDYFLNNHIFNWQAGAGFTIQSGFKFGLQYQQSTTFVAKFIEPHLRWQNISVYTGIPLFKNKRSIK